MCQESLLALQWEEIGSTPINGIPRAVFNKAMALKAFPEGSDLKLINSRFRSLQKIYAPITTGLAKSVLKPIKKCLRDSPPTDSTYGICLLQQLVLIDMTRLELKERKELAKKYINWTKTLSPDNPDYQRLMMAGQSLHKANSRM